MEGYIVKIMSFINKPIHYLYIGLFFMIWGYKYNHNLLMFVGIALLMFAFASFTEWKFKKICKVINSISYKKEIKKIYANLNKEEKKIINYCLKNNICTFPEDMFDLDDSNAYTIYSLVQKGL